MTTRTTECHDVRAAASAPPFRPRRIRAETTALGVPPAWVAAALERAELSFVTQVVRDGGIGPWREALTDRFRGARGAAAESRLSRTDTAALVVALADRLVRDRCWLQVEEDRHPEWVGLWRHLAGHALPPYRAEPMFLLAWSAWRTGDAALARAAVTAVRAADGSHHPAAMLDAMLTARLAPDDLPSLAGRDRTARGTP